MPSRLPAPRTSGAVVLFIVACTGLTCSAVLAAQDPLPDTAAFAREVRARLLSDRELQSQYTFLEHRQEIEVSKLGKVARGPLSVYEVYPSVEPGNTYKRLVSVNGVPLSAAELEKNDRKHRENVLRELRRREHESPGDRARRLKKDAAERAENQAITDEIFRLYDIRLIGRETIDAHPTVVATLEPKRGYKPRTDAGKLMLKLRARAWVSESEYQVVKVEVQVIEDVTMGWGIAGRLHKGSHGVFERRKVNGEVWLPSRVTFAGTGRTLLFRKFAVNSVTTYSDYRKFTVTTKESVHTPGR